MGDQSNYDGYSDDIDDHYGSISNSELHSVSLAENPSRWSDKPNVWNEDLVENNYPSYEPLTDLLPEEHIDSIDVHSCTSSDSDNEIETSSCNFPGELTDQPADSTPNRQPVLPCNLLLKQFTLRHHMT